MVAPDGLGAVYIICTANNFTTTPVSQIKYILVLVMVL